MKSYFKPLKNFQGFNKRFCKYRHEIKASVFIPRGDYGSNWKHSRCGSEARFCTHCLLGPCICDEYARDAYRLVAEGKHTSTPLPERRRVLQKMFLNKMKIWFGSRYMSKLPPPLCVTRFVNEHLPLDDYQDPSDSEMEFDTDGDSLSSSDDDSIGSGSDDDDDEVDLDRTLASLRV